MAYKIKKSKVFLKNVLSTVNYLEKEWSLISAQKFQSILDSKINELSNYPKMGSVISKNKNIRKLSITKNNKIYYRVLKDEINILTLFEIKMNLKRNRYE